MKKSEKYCIFRIQKIIYYKKQEDNMSRRNLAKEKSKTVNDKEIKRWDKIKEVLQIGQLIEREKEERKELEGLRNLLFDSAIVISLISMILYLFSYIYINSYYGYYGINDIDIPVSVTILIKVISELFLSNLTIVLLAFLETIGIIGFFNLIRANLNIKESIKVVFYSIYLTIFYTLTKDMPFGILKFISQVLRFFFNFYVVIAPIVIFINRYFHNTRFVSKDSKVVHFFVVFSFIGLLGYGIEEYAYNKAYNKNDYLYDKETKMVLIYQDEQKSIFFPISEDNERKYDWRNNEDLSDMELVHYYGKITF